MPWRANPDEAIAAAMKDIAPGGGARAMYVHATLSPEKFAEQLRRADLQNCVKHREGD